MFLFGIRKKKREEGRLQSTELPHPNTAVCARCGIDLRLLDKEQIVTTEGKQYCDTCADYLRKAASGPKETCATCHGTFPAAEMRAIKGKTYCKECFAKYNKRKTKASFSSTPTVAPKFEIKLPDGFGQVKQICLHKEYWLGFSYKIEMLSIIRDAEGTYYLRKYTNTCDSGANGRPCTTIRDVCYKINKDHISRINEKNWDKDIPLEQLLNPTIVFEHSNETYVDTQALNYVKENVR